jgi:sugar/nucleoside kinase (ribokinase family)
VEAAAFDVVAVGHAIVDVLSHCDDELLTRHGLVKGTMVLVDGDRATAVYDTMGPGVEVSGGSAANTAAGVASLGGSAAFIGKVADDDLGRIFSHDLRAAGVAFETAPAAPGGPGTARCLILVTPDAERTMNTFLGIAAEVGPADVDEGMVTAAAITYLEGYLVGVPSAADALAKAVRVARQAGRRVALTLSDPMWVASCPEAFADLLPSVDILLANEVEALELTGSASVEEAVPVLARSCPVVAVTRSERGAVVTDGKETAVVPAEPIARVVDTTGAGDLFASGFLYGLTRQMPLADAGRLGCLAAAEVISHVGARPQTSLRDLAASAGLL